LFLRKKISFTKNGADIYQYRPAIDWYPSAAVCQAVIRVVAKRHRLNSHEDLLAIQPIQYQPIDKQRGAADE
jgi:hypothetical protein